MTVTQTASHVVFKTKAAAASQLQSFLSFSRGVRSFSMSGTCLNTIRKLLGMRMRTSEVNVTYN